LLVVVDPVVDPVAYEFYSFDSVVYAASIAVPDSPVDPAPADPAARLVATPEADIDTLDPEPDVKDTDPDVPDTDPYSAAAPASLPPAPSVAARVQVQQYIQKYSWFTELMSLT
jgi:hypothetical protein